MGGGVVANREPGSYIYIYFFCTNTVYGPSWGCIAIFAYLELALDLAEVSGKQLVS